MNISKLKNLLYIFILFAISACSADNNGKGIDMTIIPEITSSLSNIPNNNWENLSRNKIYFAHMSVGYNIIEGMQDLMKNNPAIKLDIRKTYNPDDFKSSIFGHSKNGNNRDPKSKIDAFVNKIESGLGNKINIAILKLCYVDISSETDVDAIFRYYTDRIDAIKKQYPKTAFILCTVPLTTDKKMKLSLIQKIKDIIKSFIGKMTTKERIKKDNINREKFNTLLRNHYNKNEIFDISAHESTYADGKREFFTESGQKYFSLIGEYTYDGGHLNETGRQLIASKLLVFLSEFK